MGLILTDEEIKGAVYERNNLFGEDAVFAYTRRADANQSIAKAQLKKVVEWLEEHNAYKYEPSLFIGQTDWQALLEETK